MSGMPLFDVKTTAHLAASSGRAIAPRCAGRGKVGGLVTEALRGVKAFVC
jgi:hypothetical protein